MTALDLLQGAPHPYTPARPLAVADRRNRAPSVGSALSALLEDAREGRLTATSPGDRWLVLRIEEAMSGFHDIQQMATGDEPQLPAYAGGITGKASIRAPQVGALTPA